MRRRRPLRDLIHLPLTLDGTPPSASAFYAMDGFDNLPRSLRAVLNYSTPSMVLGSVLRPGQPPCRMLVSLVAKHGETKVLTLLLEVLSRPNSADEKVQNTTRSHISTPRRKLP